MPLLHRSKIVFAAVLLAAGVAACGGSSSSSSSRRHSARGASSSQTGGSATSPPTTSTSTTTTTKSTPTTATGTTTTPQSSTTSSGGAALSAGCTPGDLGIHFAGGSGAAGTTYLTFDFVNVTDHPCTLHGYPGVSFVLDSGATDAISNVRIPAAVHTVTIAAGGTAGFAVGVPGNAAPNCVSVQDFRFIPPNDTGYEQIKEPTVACGGKVTVTPVGDTQ
jgi:hypothetical protein